MLIPFAGCERCHFGSTFHRATRVMNTPEIDRRAYYKFELQRHRAMGNACMGVILATGFFLGYEWKLAACLSVYSLAGLTLFLFSCRSSSEFAITGTCFALLFFIVVIGSAAAYLDLGLLTGNGAPVTSFWDALYFSCITWTTVGYGDITPAPQTRFWAAGQALYATFYNGIFIAFILKALGSLEGIERKFEDHYRRERESETQAGAEREANAGRDLELYR